MSPEDLSVGYCTNVHAGVDLPAIRNNLDEYAVQVRNNLIASGGPSDEKLGVGLWIPSAASLELTTGDAAKEFAQFLDNRELSAFTINGFPYDNFHQDVVKHRVYLPTWWQRERLEYTQRLARILSAILPETETVGSISTLPIGWPANPLADDRQPGTQSVTQEQLDQAGKHFRELAASLGDLESETGRRIVVAIEPEPGCILDVTSDVIEFFASQLPDKAHRRYITVCHDVCHAAVMMEPQAEVIERLAKAEIGIGKVQVSSAIVADWQSMSDGRRREAMQQLSEFAEDRYLHQTGRRDKDGQFSLANDLPTIIATDDTIVDDLRWVVHFHVPIFLERFGHLSTSYDDVLNCLRTLLAKTPLSGETRSIQFTGHLEVETYAWTVLPEPMRKQGLAHDIAGELKWLNKTITQCG